jgi:thiamine transporter ThiT
MVVVSIRLIGPWFALLGAGFLAVFFYYRGNPARIASARSGAIIGAVTGLLSSAVSGFFFAIFVAVLQSGGEIRQELLQRLQEFAARSNDPQVLATFELLKTPEGLTKVALGMVGVFLISIAAGTLAGALTGALLSRRNQR